MTNTLSFRVGVLGAALMAVFAFGASYAHAATIFGPDAATVDNTAEYNTGTMDASGHTNLMLNFDYNAEALDNGDSFTWGWRAGGGDNDLNTFNGIDEGVVGDETSSVSVPLPLGAEASNLEVYVSVNSNASAPSDQVDISNLTVTGDPVCAPQYNVAGPTDIQNIDTGEYFNSIQNAIDDCDTVNGNTIDVAAGTYVENITLNKDITLNGAQAGVDARSRAASESTIAPASGNAITMQTGVAGATIDGFTIAGAGWGLTSNTGPLDGLTVQNNIFTPASGEVAVFLNDNGIDVTFDQNSLQGGGASGELMHLDTDNFDGFWFTNNDVVGSTGTGFFVDGNHNVGVSATPRAPKMTGNLFQGNETGVNLGTRAWEYGDISGNTFKDNSYPGLQGGIQHTTIEYNTFDGNGRSGLELTSFGNTNTDRGGQYDTVTHNIFTNNGYLHTGQGVYLSSSQAPGTIGTNVVNRNEISGNADGLYYSGAEDIDATCNWWGAADGPGGNGPGSGDTVGTGAGIDYSLWLTSSNLNGPCTGPTVTVTIDKYINGSMATNNTAQSSAFPMHSSWVTTNIGSGSGNYTLSPSGFNSSNAYEAVTSEISSGADYSTYEKTTGNDVVGASCADGKPYALVGYSSGDSLTDAESAAVSTTTPNLTNITSDKYIIVWNKLCTNLSATPEVAYNPVESDHTVTADIGVAVPDIPVAFDVTSGPDAGAGSAATTDSSGKASFTYTNNGAPGTDAITVCVDANHNNACDADEQSVTLTKYWLTDYITGGGKISDGSHGKHAKFITFGGNVGFDLAGNPVGNWETVFHNTDISGHFHATDIASIYQMKNRADCGDPGQGADFNIIKFKADGTLDGQPGWMLDVRAADEGEPGKGNDAILFHLTGPGGTFDTSAAGFPDENGSCSGSGKTKLSGGNIQIHPPLIPVL